MLWLWASRIDGGPGDAGCPAWFGCAFASATGRKRKARIPRPRQMLSGSLTQRFIRPPGLGATGVRVMNLDEGHSVAAVAPVLGTDEAEG